MFREHECVVLKRDVPEVGLKAGAAGTIVHVHRDANAYEVEFMNAEGETTAVVTLRASQLGPLPRRNPQWLSENMGRDDEVE